MFSERSTHLADIGNPGTSAVATPQLRVRAASPLKFFPRKERTPQMGWRDLIHIRIAGWGLEVHTGGLVLMFLVLLAIAIGVFHGRARRWRVTSANFKFAGLGHVDISPDDQVAKIAHNAWVELSSRKAAIEFDPDNDVIVEVYNSWYDLFRALRELAKSVPAAEIQANGDAAVLTEVLLRALNEGLRPHLTKWQARFRRWYEVALREDKYATLTPQEVQRQFPQYDDLVADLRSVSAGVIEFAEQLRLIAHQRRPLRILEKEKPRSQ